MPQHSLTFLSFHRQEPKLGGNTDGISVCAAPRSVPAGATAHGHLPLPKTHDMGYCRERGDPGTGVLDNGGPSVLCLLGAAWVHQDYVHRVLALKRQFGTRFVMTVHDRFPIYARETCDQDTAVVFEEFMRRALKHVDHILAVSKNTAMDIKRYTAWLQIPEPPITVTKNGSSFTEFLPRARARSLRASCRSTLFCLSQRSRGARITS